ncbi:MAG: HAD hydrolase-like protein [Candidatus Latescibacteria bacterium]|nr:HAD hydrolase-like protein [Candidatus Latescibacterota bacterium]
MLNLIAFDADDTLWDNEIHFERAKDRFKDLLSPGCAPEWTERELYETEMRNLAHFGYGSKGFTLSMIETALDLTQGAVTGQQIRQILEYGKELLQIPIEPLSHVESVLARLAQSHPLMLLTKGDLFDQEAKIARSGLADYFTHIEIVSEKDQQTYANLLQRYSIHPGAFCMVGNSLKSDIMPVVALGGHAVHIPYHTTWAHEKVDIGESQRRLYHQLDDLAPLPNLIETLSAPGVQG